MVHAYLDGARFNEVTSPSVDHFGRLVWNSVQKSGLINLSSDSGQEMGKDCLSVLLRRAAVAGGMGKSVQAPMAEVQLLNRFGGGA